MYTLLIIRGHLRSFSTVGTYFKTVNNKKRKGNISMRRKNSVLPAITIYFYY